MKRKIVAFGLPTAPPSEVAQDVYIAARIALMRGSGREFLQLIDHARRLENAHRN